MLNGVFMPTTNNLSSNFSRKLMEVFLEKFEAARVLTKAVDTQLFQGKFNPSSGSTVDIKRPHDYKSISTAGGDISSSTKSNIESGKATATVQNYMTVAAEYTNLQEALELNQLDEVLAPMATRLVTDLEVNLANFMSKNCALSVGVPGTAIDAWSDVAKASSLLNALGVPMDTQWHYVCGPYVQQALASVTNGLYSGSAALVDNSWEKAQISANFAGMRVSMSNCLPARTLGVSADRIGAFTGAPTATYVGAKDTMTQVWAVTGFSNGATLVAGDILEVTGRFYVSQGSRQTIFDEAGAAVKFRATVATGVTLGASGEGNVTVTGAGIYEADGGYNTVAAALTTSDVITVLGTSGATVQPALFFHPQAVALATVKLPKLYITDTVAVTKDGISLRVSKYSDGDKNLQKVRFDLLPAFGMLNPFFCGQGHGT
jgi:hypothetical protein